MAYVLWKDVNLLLRVVRLRLLKYRELGTLSYLGLGNRDDRDELTEGERKVLIDKIVVYSTSR